MASADKLSNIPLTERSNAKAILLKDVVIEFIIIPLLSIDSLLSANVN